MRITTEELRRALDLLLSELEANGASEWVIEQAFYRDVPSEERSDSHESPPQLGMGQLDADVERVKGIASGSADPLPPGLVSVARILRLAGERGVVAMKGGQGHETPRTDQNVELRRNLLLAVQVALLGEVSGVIRGITLGWSSSEIVIRAIVDGPLHEDDEESLECVASEVSAGFPAHQVAVEVRRVDAPEPLQPHGLTAWVFIRKEA